MLGAETNIGVGGKMENKVRALRRLRKMIEVQDVTLDQLKTSRGRADSRNRD